ncbi:beta-phosphoglucomutase family hydrolase [Nonomuraea sp. NPDC050227]|uniref:beta-phosphoglucomutase family hydrolase n=1 Tax=Nonomuraea sp. NPDC050227 TaxID=3364360 RepID=UPI00379B1AA1
MLGLPDGIRGCLFDMDGVLTRTATVHARAWKSMFDDFLRAWSEQTGAAFVPFDAGADYDRYVDGRKRADGARGFLDARGISLPEGTPDDPPGTMTVYGLSNRKNALVQAIIDRDGVDVFPGSVRYLAAVRDAGLRRAVVSSSANTEQVLAAAGLAGQFEARIDGVVARDRRLAGKPAPDMYLAGAEALGLRAPEAAVFEDALAGVAAGRAGGFGYVVGVDRAGQADALRDHGADVVVTDLADLLERGAPSREAG